MRSDWNHFRQLALRRKVAGYVRIECCRSLKMFGDGHMGIEYKHLLPKLMAKGEEKGSDKIATVNYHRYAKQSSAELIAEGAIS